MARRGRPGPAARAERDGAGHRRRGRHPQRPHGAAQGPGRSRPVVLHQPALAQGAGAGGQRARRGGVPVDRPTPPGHRGRRRGDAGRSRLGRVLRVAPARRAGGRRRQRPVAAGGVPRRPGGRLPGGRGHAIPTGCRGPSTGAACACARTRSSSGRDARTACTTGSASATRWASGSWSGWPPERASVAAARPVEVVLALLDGVLVALTGPRRRRWPRACCRSGARSGPSRSSRSLVIRDGLPAATTA